LKSTSDWLRLSVFGGAINAAGFQATGFFSANMTGNVSALSDKLGLGRLEVAARFGGLVAAFIFGAFASGLLIDAGRRRNAPRDLCLQHRTRRRASSAPRLHRHRLAGFWKGPRSHPGFEFHHGTAECGDDPHLERSSPLNACLWNGDDIGLACAALFGRGRDRQNALPTIRLYATMISAFLVGGVLGVLLYLALDGVFFVFAGALLLAIAAPFIRPRSRSR
jgi:hypothetical protein